MVQTCPLRTVAASAQRLALVTALLVAPPHHVPIARIRKTHGRRRELATFSFCFSGILLTASSLLDVLVAFRGLGRRRWQSGVQALFDRPSVVLPLQQRLAGADRSAETSPSLHRASQRPGRSNRGSALQVSPNRRPMLRKNKSGKMGKRVPAKTRSGTSESGIECGSPQFKAAGLPFQREQARTASLSVRRLQPARQRDATAAAARELPWR